MEALLKEQLAANADIQAQVLTLSSELSKTIAAQATAFNSYLSAASNASTPQVRIMDDWTEAALERARKEARQAEPTETLKALGLSGKDIEAEMSSFFSEFKSDFAGME